MLFIAKMLRGVFWESTRVQQNVYDICRIGTHRETPCMYVSSTFYRDKNTSGFCAPPPLFLNVAKEKLLHPRTKMVRNVKVSIIDRILTTHLGFSPIGILFISYLRRVPNYVRPLSIENVYSFQICRPNRPGQNSNKVIIVSQSYPFNWRAVMIRDSKIIN